jgi:hypothetical protein
MWSILYTTCLKRLFPSKELLVSVELPYEIEEQLNLKISTDLPSVHPGKIIYISNVKRFRQ